MVKSVEILTRKDIREEIKKAVSLEIKWFIKELRKVRERQFDLEGIIKKIQEKGIIKQK